MQALMILLISAFYMVFIKLLDIPTDYCRKKVDKIIFV